MIAFCRSSKPDLFEWYLVYYFAFIWHIALFVYAWSGDSAHVGLVGHPADTPPRLISLKEITDLVVVASDNFGTVFHAVFEGHLVVVKQPRYTAVEVQLQEYVTLARLLPHRHVLALIGAIIADNKQVWLVLPFVPGELLEQRIMQQPPWSISNPTRTQIMVADLFDGLNHLHTDNILHRECTCHQRRSVFSGSLGLYV